MIKSYIETRAGQRGAALVETAVVVPVFIVLFAGMLFLHHVVEKTQRTQLAARNSAWQSAMQSCGGGPEVEQPDLTSRMDDAPGSSASLTATVGQAAGSSDDSTFVTVLGGSPAAVSGQGGISFFQSVHSKATVYCNTTTEPGNIPGVVEWFIQSADWRRIFGG